MRFGVRFTDPARSDAVEAARWYGTQSYGLGAAFIDEVRKVTEALATSARRHSYCFGDVRRVALSRFARYNLYYVVSGEEVVVFAVRHSARDPAGLRKRREDLGY